MFQKLNTLHIATLLLFVGVIVGVAVSPSLVSAAPQINTVDSTGDVGQYVDSVTTTVTYLAYYDVTNGDLKFVRCGNAACSSTNTPTTIDSTGDVGAHVSLAIDSSGYAVIAYYDVTNGDLKLARCTSFDCATKSIETVDSTGDVGKYASLALDATNEYPVIAYYDDTNGRLKIAHCNDDDCAGSNESITTPDTNGDNGANASLVLHPTTDYPIVAYDSDYTTDRTKIVFCNDANCAGSNETFATLQFLKGPRELFLDDSSYPALIQHDDNSNDVYALLCLNATCSSSSGNKFDSTGDVGDFASGLWQPDTGTIVGAYYDATNGDLKSIFCAVNNLCNPGAEITTLDSTGDVGQYTSIGLNNTEPVIAYYDATNGDLKVVYCDTIDCGAVGVKFYETIGFPNNTEVAEGGAMDTFDVVLNQEPFATVQVNLTVDNAEVSLSSSALTFTTSNWMTPQTVTVTAVDDTVVDGTTSDAIDFTTTTTDVVFGALSGNDVVSIVVNDNDSTPTTTTSSSTSVRSNAFRMVLAQRANQTRSVRGVVSNPISLQSLLGTTLRQGSEGPGVLITKALLNAKSDSDLLMSTSFDAQTTEQVKAFQTAQSIASDGIVGPQTWGKLLSR